MQAIRKAFVNLDAEESKNAHINRTDEEGHMSGSEYIKSAVYGSLDGILTAYAIVCGATGGNMSTQVIVVLGVANIIADAFAMGVGDTVSTWSYNEHVAQERKREEWELENFPQGEIEEMVDLYESRGLPREKAEEVIRVMAKYKDFFVDVMVREELGLEMPGEDESPVRQGFVTFVSFAISGFVPLFAYIILPSVDKGRGSF